MQHKNKPEIGLSKNHARVGLCNKRNFQRKKADNFLVKTKWIAKQLSNAMRLSVNYCSDLLQLQVFLQNSHIEVRILFSKEVIMRCFIRFFNLTAISNIVNKLYWKEHHIFSHLKKFPREFEGRNSNRNVPWFTRENITDMTIVLNF